MTSFDSMLFLGTYGYVVALNKVNGQEIWRTSLPSTSYVAVSILYEDNKLYAASNGKFFILDCINGKILARNELSGKGYNFPVMATNKSQTQIIASTTKNISNTDQYIFLAINGYLMAIDKNTGNEVWNLSYKSFLHTAAGILFEDDKVYIGESGNIYCVDLNNRKIIWSNELKSLGSGCVSLINSEECLFLCVYGYAVSLNKFNGNENWRTSLPNTGYVSGTIHYEDKKLFVSLNGKFFFLNPHNGSIIYNNEMKDQGYGYFNMTTSKTEKKNISLSYNNNNNSITPMSPNSYNTQSNVVNQNFQVLYEQPPQFNNNSITVQTPLIENTQQNTTNNGLYPTIQQPSYENLNYNINNNNINVNINNNINNVNVNNNLNVNVNTHNNFNTDYNLQTPQQPSFQYTQFSNNNDNNLQVQHVQYSNNLNNGLSINNNGSSVFVSNKNCDDLIFTCLNGNICGINQEKGFIIWKSKLSSNFSSGIPNSIVYSEGKLYVGAAGKVYCLDAFSGAELWKNELPSLRYAAVTVITTNNNNTIQQSSPVMWFIPDNN